MSAARTQWDATGVMSPSDRMHDAEHSSDPRASHLV
jgi:hypothetical protein